MNDGQRVAAAIKQIDGKRLEYRESVENPPYLVPAAPKQVNTEPANTALPEPF
jgi:hypothetical protein